VKGSGIVPYAFWLDMKATEQLETAGEAPSTDPVAYTREE
jgi:hypothetical protein